MCFGGSWRCNKLAKGETQCSGNLQSSQPFMLCICSKSCQIYDLFDIEYLFLCWLHVIQNLSYIFDVTNLPSICLRYLMLQIQQGKDEKYWLSTAWKNNLRLEAFIWIFLWSTIPFIRNKWVCLTKIAAQLINHIFRVQESRKTFIMLSI